MLSRFEKQLFGLMTGAFASRALAIAVQRDLFTWLSRGGDGQTVEQVVAYLGFQERTSRVFLDVLSAIGLLRCENGLFRNTELSEQLLVRGRIADQRGAVALFDHLYLGCGTLEHTLKTGNPASREYGYFFGAGTGSYPDDMDGSGFAPALLLGEFWDFSNARHVLDVGGCLGTTAHALAARYPNLRVTVLDLPEICERGKALSKQHPASDARVTFHPGNFFDEDYPRGVDTICFVRILHDWSDKEALRLLEKAHAALQPGGRIVILETLREGSEKASLTALIDLLMLLISPEGGLRTRVAMGKLLRTAGFRRVRTKPTAYLYSLISAEK